MSGFSNLRNQRNLRIIRNILNKKMKMTRRAILITLAVSILSAPANFNATATSFGAASVLQPDISVRGYYSLDRAQRGRTVQAAVVMEIPKGYHVNSNRPLGKYAVATALKIDAPKGVRLGAVTYPRAIVRGFSFSDEKLAVYEGRAVMRFNVTVPANYEHDKIELKGRLKFQSCSDQVCYPPTWSDLSMWIDVVGTNESVKRANGQVFGGRRG
jgi:uncharacterized protein